MTTDLFHSTPKRLGVVLLLISIGGCTTNKMLDEAEKSRGIELAAPEFSISGKVVGVSDGDTIKVLAPGKKLVKIRLYGVDSPESKQAYGQKAKQFTSDLVFAKTVRAEVKDTDKYGRTVAKVFFKDGPTERELNLELAKAGFAWWFSHFAPEGHEYELAEINARTHKLGLWADRKPTPPWEFRSAAKKSGAKKR